MTISRVKPLLLTTALGMCLGFPAMATPQAYAAPSVEAAPTEVVVTGYRAASRAAVRAKKSSLVIMDTVSQDDIGRLPDLNIVEASRRIVGLSTVGGLDATKNRDIYQRAAIRGLDPKYNLITLDGSPLASSEWTVRGARLEQFPATLVARIEAIKSVTAEYDPHALGGQLNLVSKSAFDRPDHFLAMNASVGMNSSAGKFIASSKPSLRADITAAQRFGANKEFGVVVSGEYQHLYSSAITELPGDTAGAGWSYYTVAGTATPFRSLSATGYMAPVRIQDFAFDNERTRESLNAKFEYRPNDQLSASLFAGYYHDEDKETRSEILTIPGGAVTGQTATSGSFATGDYQQGIVYQPQTRKTSFYNGKLAYALTDSLTVSAVASTSHATYDEDRIFQKWAGAVTPGKTSTTPIANYGFTYTLDDGRPHIIYANPAAALDLDSYKLLYIRDVKRKSYSDVTYGKAALDWNSKEEDRGFGAKVGVSYTRTKVNFDVTYSELTSADVAGQAAIGGLSGLLYDKRTPSRENGVPYLTLNYNKVLAMVDAKSAYFIATNQTVNNFADDFNDVEQVAAAFAELQFKTDRFFGQVGLRNDATTVDILTNQASTITGSTAYTPLSRTDKYTYVLPSALAIYNFTPEMRVKGAVTQTIGRPDYSQYAARSSFSVSTGGVLTVNIGNPALKPLKATNYDLSYEWYLPRSGLFSAAVFHKDIDGLIFTGSSAGSPAQYQGVTYANVVLSQPLNAGSGKVDGLELSYEQNQLSFLPAWAKGLGFNTNLTLLDGRFDVPMSKASQAQGQSATRTVSGLILQPDYVVNATLFYVRGPFEGRVSYNKIGKALQSVDLDTPDRDLYQMARDQVDVQFRYSVTPKLDVVLQGQNIGRSPFVVRQGPSLAYVNNYFPVGSTVWLGVTFKP